jgi:hypothetical protein
MSQGMTALPNKAAAIFSAKNQHWELLYSGENQREQ